MNMHKDDVRKLLLKANGPLWVTNCDLSKRSEVEQTIKESEIALEIKTEAFDVYGSKHPRMFSVHFVGSVGSNDDRRLFLQALIATV